MRGGPRAGGGGDRGSVIGGPGRVAAGGGGGGGWQHGTGGQRAGRQDGPQVSRLEETCGTVIWAHWRLGTYRPGAFLPSHQATVHPFPAALSEGSLLPPPSTS